MWFLRTRTSRWHMGTPYIERIVRISATIKRQRFVTVEHKQTFGVENLKVGHSSVCIARHCAQRRQTKATCCLQAVR